MSGVISDNTVRSSGAVAPLSSSTLDANDPANDTNPTDGVGTKWVNTTSGEIFICIDATTDTNQWIGQITTSIQPRIFCAGGNASTTGHVSIGAFTVIEYFNPGTLGDGIVFGDLVGTNQYFSGTSNGVSDRGVFGGGNNSTVLQYITCSTLGDAIDFGDLVTIQGAPAIATDGNRALSAGGITPAPGPTEDDIYYITIVKK